MPIRYRIKGIDSNGKVMYWTGQGWAGIESATEQSLSYAREILADQNIRNRYLDADERIDAYMEQVK